MPDRIRLSNSIINDYPQPLAQIYQRIYLAYAGDRIVEGINGFHAFSEKLLKYIVTYLLLEKCTQSGSNDREARVQLRNLLLDRPTFGALSKYLREFRNHIESAEIWKCYKRSRSSEWITYLDELNGQFKSHTHNSLLSESSAEDMLLQYVIPALAGIERLEIFNEFQLCVDRNSGSPKELSGIATIEAQSGLDCSSVFLRHSGRKYLKVWPFILLEPHDSKYSVLNISSIRQNYDNVRRPGTTSAGYAASHTLEYFGAESTQKRFISTTSDNADDRTVESTVRKVLIDYRRGSTSLKLQELEGLKYKISDFSGRRWLSEDIRAFLDNPRQRLFFIKGRPGAGKSAFMLHLKTLIDEIRDNPFKDCLSAHFFFVSGNYSDSRVRPCLQQLENELGQKTGVRHGVGKDEMPVDPLEASIAKLRSLCLRLPEVDEDYQYTPILLCIDAIDEIDPAEVEQFLKIVNVLRTIPNLKILLTSRDIPELAVLAKPEVTIDLETDLRHDQDIRFYLESLPFGLHQEQSQLLLNKVNGNFQYLSFVIADLRNGLMTTDELELLPSGLDGYYDNILRVRLPSKFKHNHLNWERIGFTVLKIICIAAEAPSRSQCSNFLDVDVSLVRQAIDLMSEILIEKDDGSGYKLFHLSLKEYIKKNFEDELESAHKQIVASYMRSFQAKKWERLDSYFYRYFSHHAIWSDELDSILILANEPEFHRRTIEWIKEGDDDTPTDFPDSQGFRYAKSKMRAWAGLIEFYKFYMEIKTWRTDSPYLLLLLFVKYHPILRCLEDLSSLLIAQDGDYLGEDGATGFSGMLLLWRKNRLLAEMTTHVLEDKWLSTFYRLVLLDLGCKNVVVSNGDLASLDYFLFRSTHLGEEYNPWTPNVEAMVFKYIRKLGSAARERVLQVSSQFERILCLDDKVPISEVRIPDFDIESLDAFVLQKIDRLNQDSIEQISFADILDFVAAVSADEERNRTAYTLVLTRRYGQLLGTGHNKPLVAAIFRINSPILRTILIEDFIGQFDVGDLTPEQIEMVFAQYVKTICRGNEGAVLDWIIPFEGSGNLLRYIFLEQTATFLWKCHNLEFRRFTANAFNIALVHSFHQTGSQLTWMPPFRLLDSDFFYNEFIQKQDDSLDDLVDLMCDAWCTVNYDLKMRRMNPAVKHWFENGKLMWRHLPDLPLDKVPFSFDCPVEASFFLDRLIRPEGDFADDLIDLVSDGNFVTLCKLQKDGGNFVLSDKLREKIWKCVNFHQSTREVINNILDTIARQN